MSISLAQYLSPRLPWTDRHTMAMAFGCTFDSTLSLREGQDLLAGRGNIVSHEAIRH